MMMRMATKGDGTERRKQEQNKRGEKAEDGEVGSWDLMEFQNGRNRDKHDYYHN